MKRILIIKFGALGDVVMATALIDAISRHHGKDAVSLATTPAFAPLFSPWSGLSIHVSPRRGLRNMMSLLGWIRRQGFSRIYDLQGNDRSGLLCALSAVEERVGNHCRFPYTHHPASPWRGQCHIFERMCAVLASAGVEVTAQVPLLPPTAATTERVRAWVAHHGLEPGRFVLLHGGASPLRADKRWPRFDELGQRLRTAGIRIVWLGAEPERELNAALARPPDIDATDAFDILDLAELGRLARFAVTNDSGPMHVLAASGIPVFGLFGPSDWRRNHALGQRPRVIACVDHVAAYAGRRTGACLHALEVDVVWDRLVDAGLV